MGSGPIHYESPQKPLSNLAWNLGVIMSACVATAPTHTDGQRLPVCCEVSIAQIPLRYRDRLPRGVRSCYIQEPIPSHDRPGSYLTRIAVTPDGLRKAGPIYLDPEREDQREALSTFVALLKAAQEDPACQTGTLRAFPASWLPQDIRSGIALCSGETTLYLEETGVIGELGHDDGVVRVQLVHLAALPHYLVHPCQHRILSFWMLQDLVERAPEWGSELASRETLAQREQVQRYIMEHGGHAESIAAKTTFPTDPPQPTSEQLALLPLKETIELAEEDLQGFNPELQVAVLDAVRNKVEQIQRFGSWQGSHHSIASLPRRQLHAMQACIEAIKWWYLSIPPEAREPITWARPIDDAHGYTIGYQVIIGVPYCLASMIERNLFVLPKNTPRFDASQSAAAERRSLQVTAAA